ncbi:MBL fold metallo-hydrolase [Anaerocellum danielii]|uniref:Metallo-beta-lactamase domain-containing protein n=1 Tax=Anaerocellum danielii TaxID=1387557 RepID=A0ABZ0U6W8_9FIRM|nr:hypothetical protein [Caldicellulosiruptor danielii]WPX09500.1 hypothetical protein SOJ16_000712 [Caldicellulosiruptor danielii]
MENQFNFFSVGQGLFATATWCNFNIVYDCDSTRMSIIEDQVKNYVMNVLTNKKIDILFISHFHEDHINGLFYLLEMATEVGCIFMPYIPLINRIYIILQLLARNRKTSNNLGRLVEFVFDPVSYLSNNFSGKIKKETYFLY